MNKTTIKIFSYFTALSATIAVILLAINFFCFTLLASDLPLFMRDFSPRQTLSALSHGLSESASGFTLADDAVLPENCWCILIDENGKVIWSQNKPDDIPEQYSLNDIAKMTRWYLNDYPVYVHTEDYGLLVLGLPKNSVAKYDIAYSISWFDTLPQRVAAILFINLLLATVLAVIIGLSLYRRLNILTNGIRDLRLEKDIKLKESGIFKELMKNINNTAASIAHKNAALAVREQARSHWIAGISHDIRTPLALIMGNAEALESSGALSEEYRKKAAAITTQSIKIRKLIEDLNLISKLEYDMQPAKRKSVPVCPFLRETVSSIMNSGLLENYEIELDLQNEKASVSADISLLERAIFNLINNSITHNPAGCKISIQAYASSQTAHIIIADNGSGVPESVLEKIAEIPKSAHGLGLPMAYKIIAVHGGKLTAENKDGFAVHIELPLE